MRKKRLPGSKFKITSGIYKITCISTGDLYVGKSKNLNQRWCQHRSDLRTGIHVNQQIQELYNTHGPRAFEMELLELVEDVATLETREVYYVTLLKPNLNVVNTRLSQNDAAEIRKLVDSGVDESEILSRYNLTRKYLLEILRGGRWANTLKINE